MGTDVADWTFAEITKWITGSAALTPSALTWFLGTGLIPTQRWVTAIFTTDTAGLVTIGTHVGAGSGVSSAFFTFYMLPGTPILIPFGDEGWLSAASGQVQWAASHSVSGATLAWAIGFAT